MRINNDKTKELTIYFGRRHLVSDVPELTVGGINIEKVCSFKVLGVIISQDLTWKEHVLACKRLFIIYQLIRSGISVADVIAIYCSLIRSVLEYCSPVWHCGLSLGQSTEIESVQKRV